MGYQQHDRQGPVTIITVCLVYQKNKEIWTIIARKWGKKKTSMKYEEKGEKENTTDLKQAG